MTAACKNYSTSRLWAAAFAMHKKYMTKEPDSDHQFLTDFADSTSMCEPPDSLSNMLKVYGVSRYFSKVRPAQKDVWKHVRKITSRSEWAELKISEKARALQERLPGRDNTKIGPISAASKIAWFYSPKDWTMFDSRASAAFGYSSFEKFYEGLNEKGFKDFSEFNVLDNYGSDGKIYPTRVLDKALFILGGIDNYKVITDEPQNNDALNFGQCFDKYLSNRDNGIRQKLIRKFRLHAEN